MPRERQADRERCQRKAEMSPFVQSRNGPLLPACSADQGACASRAVEVVRVAFSPVFPRARSPLHRKAAVERRWITRPGSDAPSRPGATSCRGALRRSGLERPAPRMVRRRLPIRPRRLFRLRRVHPAPHALPVLTGTAASPSASTRCASFRPLRSTDAAPSKPLHTVTAAPRSRRPLPSPTSWYSRRSNLNVRFFDSFRVACSHRIRSSSSASCRTGRCASSASRGATAKRRLWSAMNFGRYAFAASNDRTLVTSGLGAVGRYALPSPCQHNLPANSRHFRAKR